MYIKRTLEEQIKRASDFFPVVLVTGPRQVGKTTVLKNCEPEKRKYVSLDILEDRMMAKQNPQLFLERYSAPVLIDEVQYAPELFPYIKAIVDKEQKPGMFWLTGSQQFHLMKNVTESLAGRIGILNLQGLSQDEQENKPICLPFLPTQEFIDSKADRKTTLLTIYDRIWKGSFPKLYDADDSFWTSYYSAYLRTYIERDIKDLSQITNELDFLKFMQVLAARTGQELVYKDIADDVGVSQPTVKSWLSVLVASNIVYILQPYFNNITKRAIKTPKIYFLDTGLACYLTGWTSANVLETGAMSGAMLETFVVSEILKSYWHNGREPALYYYRDKQKQEIDLLLEENGLLYPVEIKKKSNPDMGDIKTFDLIENQLHKKAGNGAVICMADTHRPLTEKVTIIPVGYL